ncbi:hypothetical protein SDC9_116944 [bioreactor metagenome]|uniref:Uncharacterized protein n=1 Tax=bioreactor metagenome TaxID=1076179 RepID=A0A645BWV2_9ZZZZ
MKRNGLYEPLKLKNNETTHFRKENALAELSRNGELLR